MTFLGVDLHKREFTVCYRHSENNQVIREFENSPEGRDEFLTTVSCRDTVAVESLGFDRFFVKLIAPKVKKVVSVHPGANRIVSESSKKTDKNDAAGLAWGLEKGVLPKSRFRSEISHQLSRLLTCRASLIGMRTKITNQLNFIVATNGLDVPLGKLKYRLWRDRVPVETFEFGDYQAWLAFDAQLEKIGESVNQLDREIISNSKHFAGYKVLEGIPGFGKVTIAELLAYIDGIENFTSSKSLCAYFGIVPRIRQSAGQNILPKKYSRFKAGAITRQGRSSARCAIVMSVNRVVPENQSLRDFYERIKGRKGYRKARTATARKLLTFVYFALKKGEAISDFGKVDFSKPHELPN
ncbi:MAG: IS110 family transposase [Kordiimonadaceae bacterium]|nr:IS110 family transposase [Kordiimonadaceae bacterium]MBO6569333.1 IS110 family transposase [Kordiimonadaceae bacterium]MBO6964808.1 IS110 family transposase [Kordiimonadaceae bacterium]